MYIFFCVSEKKESQFWNDMRGLANAKCINVNEQMMTEFIFGSTIPLALSRS